MGLEQLFSGGIIDQDGRFFYCILVAVAVLAISRLFLDTYYFIRFAWNGVYHVLSHKLGRPQNGLLDEVVLSVRCLPSDIDHYWHMNNARYNRECDFGRHQLFMANGLYKLFWLNKIAIGLAATTIRFRRSINFLESSLLKSKVVYWDDRSIYVEQTFYRKSDSFVLSTLYAKLTIVKSSPEQVLKLYGFTGEKPAPTEDLLSWISYCEQSSERFRPKTQ